MRILTRKKGNKKYFYLQHSLRKGKKVVTKEKYLGTEIPDDINEITSAFRKEMQSDINKKLEKIKEHFQSEWKRIPESAKEKELEEISISFTYNTNAIEGSTITLEDARVSSFFNICKNTLLCASVSLTSLNGLFGEILS